MIDITIAQNSIIIKNSSKIIFMKKIDLTQTIASRKIDSLIISGCSYYLKDENNSIINCEKVNIPELFGIQLYVYTPVGRYGVMITEIFKNATMIININTGIILFNLITSPHYI